MQWQHNFGTHTHTHTHTSYLSVKPKSHACSITEKQQGPKDSQAKCHSYNRRLLQQYTYNNLFKCSHKCAQHILKHNSKGVFKFAQFES